MNSLTDLLRNHIYFPLIYKTKLKILHFHRSGGRIEKPRGGRGGFKRGGRGGRGRGRGGKKEPAPSAEDLDKELDNYLKAR